MIFVVSTKEPYKTVEFDYAKLKSIVDTFITEVTPILNVQYKIEFEKENLMVSPTLNLKHFYCFKYLLKSHDKKSSSLSLYIMFDEQDSKFNLYVSHDGEQCAIRVESLNQILDRESFNHSIENPSHRFVYTYELNNE